jgi:hypothetical protein
LRIVAPQAADSSGHFRQHRNMLGEAERAMRAAEEALARARADSAALLAAAEMKKRQLLGEQVVALAASFGYAAEVDELCEGAPWPVWLLPQPTVRFEWHVPHH